MARKSITGKTLAERTYSHRVYVEVPPGGLGSRLNAMHEWCRERGGCDWAQHGHQRRQPGEVPVDHARFYFSEEADAVAFRQRWGGDLSSGSTQ